MSKKLRDINENERARTVMLRERVFRVQFEISRRQVRKFLRDHKGWTVGMSVVLAIVIFVPLLMKIGFAGSADFYPSSCLGSWQNVQNALGKPDLAPGAPANAFTSINSAVFSTSSEQMFCGNFSGDEDITALASKHFNSASVVLSWTVRPPESGDAGGGGEAPAAAPAPDSSSSVSSSTDGNDTASSAPSTATDSSSTSWLDPFIHIAFADDSAASDTNPADALTVDTSTSASASASDTPADIVTASDTAVTQEVTTTPSALQVNTAAFQNIPIPSSTPGDFLSIVYSTDGVTWQTVANVNAANWQIARFPLPISSWDELKHLQIALVGLDNTGAPYIYADAIGVEVDYADDGVATVPSPTIPDPETAVPAPAVVPGSAAREAPPPSPPPAPEAQLKQVFSPFAEQSCNVTPFSSVIVPGTTGTYILKMKAGSASGTAPLYQASIGSTPAGVSAIIVPGQAGVGTITASVAPGTAPGSYTVIVVYTERQHDGTELPANCQFNIEVK